MTNGPFEELVKAAIPFSLGYTNLVIDDLKAALHRVAVEGGQNEIVAARYADALIRRAKEAIECEHHAPVSTCICGPGCHKIDARDAVREATSGQVERSDANESGSDSAG